MQRFCRGRRPPRVVLRLVPHALCACIATAILSGCIQARTPHAEMVTTQLDPKTVKITIRPLSKKSGQDLAAARQWFEVQARAVNGRTKTAEDKVSTIDAIIRAKSFSRSDWLYWQYLGVILGDAIAQKTGFRWVDIEGVYGETAGLTKEGAESDVTIFPIEMLWKRVQRGETVDARFLFDALVPYVNKVE